MKSKSFLIIFLAMLIGSPTFIATKRTLKFLPLQKIRYGVRGDCFSLYITKKILNDGEEKQLYHGMILPSHHKYHSYRAVFKKYRNNITPKKDGEERE